MPATFDFQLDTGTATGTPAKGTTRNTGITNNNWKNVDDAGTAYTASPITAGNNSYERFLFAKFTGTFTSISNGLWAHTAGAFGTGITLKGIVTSTYTTPSTTANAAFTVDMTSVIGIGSGQTVLFGPTGPEVSGTMAASSTSNPTYSQYLATQLQTTVSAAGGDTATATLTLQYQEF